jgi:anti-sigma factor RsiW
MKKQCKEYEFLITQYCDGEAEEPDKRELFLHVAACDSCRAFWETMTDMKLQAARENRQNAPTTLDRRVKSATLQRTSSMRIARVWDRLVGQRLFVPVPLALLFALFLLSGGAGIAFLVSSSQPPIKEVIEPVVFVKLPTVEINGNGEQSDSSVQ